MKKILVLSAAVLFFTVAGFAQKHPKKIKKTETKVEEAPASVQNAFGQSFNDAVDVKWKKTALGNWDAVFRRDSLQADALYTESGDLVATHTEYTAENLPANILGAVKAKYPDATVKEGVNIRRTDVAGYYKVSIEEGGSDKDLLISEDGATVTE